MHRTLKKSLSVVLSLLMVLSAFGGLSFTAAATMTKADDLPTFTFYVPETLYLNASDNKTIQYYVDRQQAVDGALTASNGDTSGWLYFYCEGATSVDSLSVDTSVATISLTNTSSSTGELKTLAQAGGSLKNAIAMNGVVLVPWTVTFTYNDNQYSATAYSVAYAPNRNVTADGVYGFDYNSKESCASGLIWIQGAQTTGQATYTDRDSSSSGRVVAYQNVSTATDSKYLDPLVNGINAHPNESRPSSYSTGTSPFTGATKSFLGCNCVKEDERDGNGDWVVHYDYNKTSAEIIVDTSRYTNTNQIPNLKLGFMVTDWANSNSRRNWYVSDATSAVTNPDNHDNASLVDDSSHDLFQHAYWRSDTDASRAYSGVYGTILRHSGGGTTPSMDNTYTDGENIDGDTDDEGLKYLEPISYAVSSGTHYRYFKYGLTGNKSSSWAMSIGIVNLKVTAVDKGSLRDLINEYVGTYMSDYYTTSSWNTYSTALQNAYRVLGNPAATADNISSAESSLATARNGLVRKTGSATVNHYNAAGTALLETETITFNYGDTVTVTPNEYAGYTYTSASPAELEVKNAKTGSLVWTLTYTPISYDIDFTLNGGSAEGLPASYTIESGAITLPTPTFENHIFTGWSGTDLTGEDNMTVTIPAGSTGDREYTAHWKLKTYTVTFLDDEGVVIGTPQIVEHGSDAVPPDDLTKASDATNHYVFDGWSGYTNITKNTYIQGLFTPVAHVYDQTNTDEAYLKSAATCTAKAQYYYSCVCGRKGTATFASGQPNGHTMTPYAANAATCTAAGNSAYWYCSVCEKYFSDENGTHEIAQNSWVIPASGHHYATPADADWTWTPDGDTYTVTVNVTCEQGDDTQTLTADVVLTDSQEGTHLTNGYNTFTATATIGNQTFTATRTDEFIATGHVWDYTGENVRYDWAADFTSCTATVPCKYCDETTTVNAQNITHTTTTVPACNEDGIETYVATFENAQLGSSATENLGRNASNHAGGTEVRDVVVANCHTNAYSGDTYCLGCGNKISDGVTGEKDMTKHDGATEVRNIVEANCHTNAYSGDTYCLGCGNKISDGVTGEKDMNRHDGEVKTRRVNEIAGTCMAEATWTLETYCDGCGTTLSSENKTGEKDMDNHVTDETVLLNAQPAGYTFTGYTGDTCCAACRSVITPGETIEKISIDTNGVVTTAKGVKADAEADPTMYEADQVAALNNKLDELAAALLIDNNDEAVHTIIGELDTLLRSMDVIIYYNVTFTVDGVPVDTQRVREGYNAEAPAQAAYINNDENHKRFSGWTGDYTNVQDNLTITATYEEEDHAWADGDITLAPTCSEKGTQDQACICGATNVKILEKDPNNHADYGTELINFVETTCKRDGYTGDTVCARCRAVLEPGASVSKETVAHTPGEPTETVNRAATCMLAGEKLVIVKCTVCEKTLSRTTETIDIDPDNHTGNNSVTRENVIPATCTDPGSCTEIVTCECGAELSRIDNKTLPIDPDAHLAGEPESEETLAPTCGAEGERTVTVKCTRCGETISRTTEAIPATGAHTMTFVPAKEATEDTDGYKEHWYCAECDGYYVDEAGMEPIDRRALRIPAISSAGHCLYCGEVHTGVFGSIIHIFHLIRYFFSLLSNLSRSGG